MKQRPICRFRRIRHVAIFLVAICLMNTLATAQMNLRMTPQLAPAAAPSDCPPPKDIKAAQLYGLWTVRFMNPPDSLPVTATLLLEQHAEFSDSLAGIVGRDLGAASGSQKISAHAAKAALAGDLEEGFLLLDESSDNVSITGTWNGEVVADSCGKVIRGNWKDTSSSASADAQDVPFVMRRLP